MVIPDASIGVFTPDLAHPLSKCPRYWQAEPPKRLFYIISASAARSAEYEAVHRHPSYGSKQFAEPLELHIAELWQSFMPEVGIKNDVFL